MQELALNRVLAVLGNEVALRKHDDHGHAILLELRENDSRFVGGSFGERNDVDGQVGEHAAILADLRVRRIRQGNVGKARLSGSVQNGTRIDLRLRIS